MINRKLVHEKYNGKCAYCGVRIHLRQMQVDHLHPKYLSHTEPDLDNDRYDNLMPACRKCNIHKGGMRLEMWRSELGLQITRLKKNTQFDRALRFKQLEIKERPIVFYFEVVA